MITITIDLTDEQVEWAKLVSKEHPHTNNTKVRDQVAHAIVAALPQPTLRERAYKVVYGAKRAMDWEQDDIAAVVDMASWLYENAGERYWMVGCVDAVGDRFYAALREDVIGVHFDSLVDACAHAVVGLGESNEHP